MQISWGCLDQPVYLPESKRFFIAVPVLFWQAPVAIFTAQ